MTEEKQRSSRGLLAESDSYAWTKAPLGGDDFNFPQRIKIISLWQFPPVCLLQSEKNRSYLISGYISQIIQESHAPPGCCIYFPPLDSLVEWFHASEEDVKQAFLVLKTQGHYYQIFGNLGNIVLWVRTIYDGT